MPPFPCKQTRSARLRSAVHLAVLAAAFGCNPHHHSASAQQAEDGNTLARPTATSSVQTVHAGERFLLVVRFEIEPDWHIYWENPGETGSPTFLDVKAPEGFRVGSILWPRPMVIPGDFTSYGYEDETTIFIPILAPAELTDGTATFELDIDWLVCKEICHIGEKALQVEVGTSAQPAPRPTGSGEADAEADESDSDASAEQEPRTGRRFDDPAVEAAFRLLPRPLNRIRRGVIEVQGDTVTITGPSFGHDKFTYIPNNSPGVSTEVLEQNVNGRRFQIVLRTTVNENNTQNQAPTVGGVIAFGENRDDPSIEFSQSLRRRSGRRSAGD